MPVTVGGTSITFNDSTAQTTSATGTIRSASDSIICGKITPEYVNGGTGNVIYNSFSLAIIGSVRFKLYCAGAADGKGNSRAGYVTFYKNGVHQGTWGKGGPGYALVANLDLSVKPGDVFSLGGYYQGAVWSPYGQASFYCDLGMA